MRILQRSLTQGQARLDPAAFLVQLPSRATDGCRSECHILHKAQISISLVLRRPPAGHVLLQPGMPVVRIGWRRIRWGIHPDFANLRCWFGWLFHRLFRWLVWLFQWLFHWLFWLLQWLLHWLLHCVHLLNRVHLQACRSAER